ncbi:MAG: arylsulfatase [Betaproteobacteria bacterium]|nr:arylsulfatase [Betaproteobacteria bacterium]
MPAAQPNIVLILADNLGWGELGCYGGGVLRGAPTPRIDAIAAQGLRLTNFNVESDCVPTRSALMTGRHPIRTGAIQSVPAGLPQGLTPWEITLAQLLGGQGYATGIFGKWHLGDRPGRFPHERGFDEWYGIPRTTNESMFTSTPGFDANVVPMPYVMQARRGEPAQNVAVYDLELRRKIDSQLIERSIDFMSRQHKAGKPFFAYVPLTQLHYPTIPHHDFSGKSGAGDFADAMIEMDYRVSQVYDFINFSGLGENTVFIFASDNGPEFRRPWRGSAGMWSGTYHTAMEGALRVPFILHWPKRVAPRVSNEIVHITDLFVTLAKIAGATVPTDRPIDGVDQSDFLFGNSEKSAREGFVYYIKQELRAAKWRDWKMHIVWEPEPNVGPNHLETPWVFNVVQDPKEESDVGNHQGWVRRPLRMLIEDFQASLKQHPPIPPGAPDDYRPKSNTQ